MITALGGIGECGVRELNVDLIEIIVRIACGVLHGGNTLRSSSMCVAHGGYGEVPISRTEGAQAGGQISRFAHYPARNRVITIQPHLASSHPIIVQLKQKQAALEPRPNSDILSQPRAAISLLSKVPDEDR